MSMLFIKFSLFLNVLYMILDYSCFSLKSMNGYFYEDLKARISIGRKGPNHITSWFGGYD